MSRPSTESAGTLLSARSWRVGGEVVAIGLGQALGVAGALAAVRLLTEYLPPAAYGELALGMTGAVLGTQVIFGPVATAASRFFAPAREAGQLRGYLAGLRALTVWASLALAALAAIAVAVAAFGARPIAIGLVLGAFGFAFTSGGSAILGGVQNAARQRVIAAAHDGVAPWLRVLVAIALMHLLTARTSGIAITGYALASALVALSQLAFFRARIRSLAAGEPSTESDRWFVEMKTYAWPFVTWGIFTWAQVASDRWALEVFAGTHEVGLYTVLYQLGFYPLQMLATLLVQVAAPVLYARAGDATDPVRLAAAFRLTRLLALATVAATIAGTLVAAVAHPLVGRLLLAEAYRGVTHLFPWMVAAGGLFATGQVMALLFMLANRSRMLIAPKIVTAVIGIALNVAGARLYGTRGVIAAAIAFSLLFCVWLTISAARTFGRGAAS